VKVAGMQLLVNAVPDVTHSLVSRLSCVQQQAKEMPKFSSLACSYLLDFQFFFK
jgi:hypothetical protein